MPKEDFLEEQLEKLEFEPCSAHAPMTSGWIAPLEEDDDYFVHSYKNYLLFCLQVEEKIIPAYVIRQELKEKIKELESTQGRKISPKEKYSIKEDIYKALLPQAFSRLTKIYAYFDVANRRLILNTTNAKKTEIFISMLQKTIDDIAITSLPLKKLHTIMTNWIQRDNCPKPFYIEDACVLKEPAMASKVIRFKGQDLFSESIKSFLIEGYKVDQIVINWQERATFVLKENFHICTIKYIEKVTAETTEDLAGTEEEKFIADFIIMTDLINLLLNDLLKICEKKGGD
jgi:recombination associated protein RdgC